MRNKGQPLRNNGIRLKQQVTPVNIKGSPIENKGKLGKIEGKPTHIKRKPETQENQWKSQ